MNSHINLICSAVSVARTLVLRRAFHANCRQVTAAGPLDSLGTAEFDRLTNNLSDPLVMYGPPKNSFTLPAIEKWFRGTGLEASFNEPYFADVKDNTLMRYELAGPQPTANGNDAISVFCRTFSGREDTPIFSNLIRPTEAPDFFMFDAPLALMMAACTFNSQMRGEGATVGGLYISQNPLRSLPPSLLRDVPVPELASNAGNGDIYSTSIWIGLEPTYTPLHRDPNPNIFAQLCGTKILRLLPPSSGEALFHQVQAALGTWGSSRIRSTEMMAGPERNLLGEKVWTETHKDLVEATVNPGDAIFIPKGWWHSVRSSSSDGRLNSSVNWWFRWRDEKRRAYMPPVRPNPKLKPRP